MDSERDAVDIDWSRIINTDRMRRWVCYNRLSGRNSEKTGTATIGRARLEPPKQTVLFLQEQNLITK